MTETTLPPWTAASLAMLLDALDGVALSASERASLAWLAEFGTHTVKNIAVMITRVRQPQEGEQ